MGPTIFKNSIRFVFLIILQVLVLNNIQLNHYINPYLYILFIILLPFNTPPSVLLISSFFLGLGVDLFSNTIGMHASASVFVAFCRPFILKSISQGGEFEQGEKPTLEHFSIRWLITYALLMVSAHHVVLFFVEVFSFNGFWQTLGRAITSIIFTMILIIISHYLIYNPKK